MVEHEGSKVRHAGRSFVPIDQSTQPGRLNGSQRVDFVERNPRRGPLEEVEEPGVLVEGASEQKKVMPMNTAEK